MTDEAWPSPSTPPGPADGPQAKTVVTADDAFDAFCELLGWSRTRDETTQVPYRPEAVGEVVRAAAAWTIGQGEFPEPAHPSLWRVVESVRVMLAGGLTGDEVTVQWLRAKQETQWRLAGRPGLQQPSPTG